MTLVVMHTKSILFLLFPSPKQSIFYLLIINASYLFFIIPGHCLPVTSPP
jgi:hypothetical protein